MNIFGKIMETMRLNDKEDDDYFYDEEESYEDEKPTRKTIFSKKDMGADDADEDSEPSRPRFLSRSSKVVPMKRGMEVTLIKPTSIEDEREVCDFLLAGKAVVLNMEGIHTELAQRIIDFTSGATYSMNGNLQKIANYIFIATPESVELSGDFQELINNGALDISGLNLRL